MQESVSSNTKLNSFNTISWHYFNEGKRGIISAHISNKNNPPTNSNKLIGTITVPDKLHRAIFKLLLWQNHIDETICALQAKKELPEHLSYRKIQRLFRVVEQLNCHRVAWHILKKCAAHKVFKPQCKFTDLEEMLSSWREISQHFPSAEERFNKNEQDKAIRFIENFGESSICIINDYYMQAAVHSFLYLGKTGNINHIFEKAGLGVGITEQYGLRLGLLEPCLFAYTNKINNDFSVLAIKIKALTAPLF